MPVGTIASPRNSISGGLAPSLALAGTPIAVTTAITTATASLLPGRIAPSFLDHSDGSRRRPDPSGPDYGVPMREVLPGTFHWTTLHPRIHIPVSSYWLDEAGVLIDPLVPTEEGLEWFAGRRVHPTAVLLSNRHHYRESARFVEAFGCTVHCNRAGMHEFTHGETIEGFDPETCSPAVRASRGGRPLSGRLCALPPDKRAVAFADGLVRGSPLRTDGPLGFVPDVLMDDPPATSAHRSPLSRAYWTSCTSSTSCSRTATL